jgi:hypothetical protein
MRPAGMFAWRSGATSSSASASAEEMIQRKLDPASLVGGPMPRRNRGAGGPMPRPIRWPHDPAKIRTGWPHKVAKSQLALCGGRRGGQQCPIESAGAGWSHHRDQYKRHEQTDSDGAPLTKAGAAA